MLLTILIIKTPPKRKLLGDVFKKIGGRTLKIKSEIFVVQTFQTKSTTFWQNKAVLKIQMYQISESYNLIISVIIKII